MRLTKNSMARVVVQALYGLPDLPPADHKEVAWRARSTVERLKRQHEMACTVLLNAKNRAALQMVEDEFDGN